MPDTPHTPPPRRSSGEQSGDIESSDDLTAMLEAEAARSDDVAARHPTTRLPEPAENGFSRFFSSSRSRLNVLSTGRRPRDSVLPCDGDDAFRLARAAIAEEDVVGAVHYVHAGLELVDVDLAAAGH